GFQMRSMYPSIAHLQSFLSELTGRHQAVLPAFKEVRIDDPITTRKVFTLHQTLTDASDPLEQESRFIETLAYLIKRYADICSIEQTIGNERDAVQKARGYIEENFAAQISLNDLAQHAALSPYHFLRVFQAEVGMPPHAYLQDVRIRRAQGLIALGEALTDVAFDVGFSSQSHLTRRFKQIVGITPGQYAQQIQPTGGLKQ
ncbi:MAG: AraC family transcriptional regulator, partial [Chloroflexota bacterium]